MREEPHVDLREARRAGVILALSVVGLAAIASCKGQEHQAAQLGGTGGSTAATPTTFGGSGNESGGAAAASASGPGGQSPSGAGGNGIGSGSGAGGGSGNAGSSALDAGVADLGLGQDAQSSATALDQLTTYLKIARASRGELSMQPFASVALTRDHAAEATRRLWDDFAQNVRDTRANEVGATETTAKSVQVGMTTMKYYLAKRGSEPPDGRSLFISMHGGGNATADVNDQQWQNQIMLVDGYNPKDAVWVAPRAPSNDWNMWFTEEIDPLFERLITDMIVFEGVNPNKIYLNGYSAGGDAVHQLGPRMAERWAGAAMSAGHPNDASPVNLRDLAFAIHVGGDDTAYDRNLKAMEWGQMLDQLAAQDPGGYPHQWQVHAGLPHWMNLEDAVSVPFIQGFTRNPVPDKIVWRQVNVTRSRFYWLAVDVMNRKPGTEIHAHYADTGVVIDSAQNLSKILVRFSDAMLNLDQPVRIESSGTELFSGKVPRTIAVIARTLEESGDSSMTFYGEVAVALR